MSVYDFYKKSTISENKVPKSKKNRACGGLNPMDFPCMKSLNLKMFAPAAGQIQYFPLLPYAGAKNSVFNLRRIPWTMPAAGAKISRFNDVIQGEFYGF